MAFTLPDAIGDYKILEQIGHGGMGTLYRALDLNIGREVAIKLLREGLDDPEVRERFAREARSAGRLKHGNIVTIFELGEHGGVPFIAMEYVQGETLAAFLKRKPAVSVSRKLQIMEQLCAGLHYAHRMSVVHRDVKPANIMIDDEGTVKILDFGIARIGSSMMTQAGMVIGTLNYMAPEQMEGKPVDARADIFSLGAVFYELLAYRHAFTGEGQGAVMHKILYGRPDPLETVCPGLDAQIIAVINRCLEKQPDKRYADLAEARREIEAVRRRVELAGSSETDAATLPGFALSSYQAQPGPTPPSTGARKESSSIERLRGRAEQMRAEQIQAHIERGRRALEEGDYDAAFAACEQALVLDPQHPPALELEEQTRAGMERQVQDLLVKARTEVERGALTAASLLAERVLLVNAESQDAQAILQAVEEARARMAADAEKPPEPETAFSDSRMPPASDLASAATILIERSVALEPSSTRAHALKEESAGDSQRIDEEKRKAERLERERVERLEVEAVARRQRESAEAERRQEEAERLKAEARAVAEKESANAAVLPPASEPVAAPSVSAGAGRLPALFGRDRIPATLLAAGTALVLIVAAFAGARWWRSGETAPPAGQQAAPAPAAPANDAGQALSRARELIDRGDYDTALKELEALGDNREAADLRERIAGLKAAQTAQQAEQAASETSSQPADRAPAAADSATSRGRGNADARARDLAGRYTRAKGALDAAAFSTAVTLLEDLQRDEPNYRDVPALLARARDGINGVARQAFEAGTRLESSGDLIGALQEFTRAQQVDPTMASAQEAIARVKASMRAEGGEAFTRGKQYDAVNLVDQAIVWYERAYRILPDDDARKKTAKDMLDALRARR